VETGYGEKVSEPGSTEMIAPFVRDSVTQEKGCIEIRLIPVQVGSQPKQGVLSKPIQGPTHQGGKASNGKRLPGHREDQAVVGEIGPGKNALLRHGSNVVEPAGIVEIMKGPEVQANQQDVSQKVPPGGLPGLPDGQENFPFHGDRSPVRDGLVQPETKPGPVGRKFGRTIDFGQEKGVSLFQEGLERGGRRERGVGLSAESRTEGEKEDDCGRRAAQPSASGKKTQEGKEEK